MKLDAEGAKQREWPGYQDRMRAARRRAQWELGDPDWAEVIVGAFLCPEGDAAALEDEKENL